MEDKHKEAIQSNFASLVERTDLDKMVTALYEKGVFSEQMIEPYQNNYDSLQARKRLLYREITRRGPNAFRHLVDTLYEQGYWNIVKALDPESSISSQNPHTIPPISSTVKPNPKLPNPESEYVSISNERIRTKNELQRNAAAATPDPPPPPPPAPVDADSAAPIIPQFDVIKSTKFMDEDDKGLKLYKTRGRSRGYLMVFSYIQFKDNIEEPRGGVDVDCANLKYLFSEMGFRVLSYPDLTKKTIDTLSSLESVLKDAETVFIVVSSHGYQRSGTTNIDIRCSDGHLVSFMDIMSYFSNSALPALIGIPKVLVFQTCRGSNTDFVWNGKRLPPPPPGHVRADGTPSGGGAPQDPAPSLYEGAEAGPKAMPLYTDILIAHSTLPGQVSFRDGGLGSWYIQAMCEVFAESAHDTDVDTLFTLVDERMRLSFKRQASAIEKWSFNPKLYLHPGLYE